MGYSVRTDDHRYNIYPAFDTQTWTPDWLKNIRRYEDKGDER